MKRRQRPMRQFSGNPYSEQSNDALVKMSRFKNSFRPDAQADVKAAQEGFVMSAQSKYEKMLREKRPPMDKDSVAKYFM